MDTVNSIEKSKVIAQTIKKRVYILLHFYYFHFEVDTTTTFFFYAYVRIFYGNRGYGIEKQNNHEEEVKGSKG